MMSHATHAGVRAAGLRAGMNDRSIALPKLASTGSKNEARASAVRVIPMLAQLNPKARGSVRGVEVLPDRENVCPVGNCAVTRRRSSQKGSRLCGLCARFVTWPMPYAWEGADY